VTPIRIDRSRRGPDTWLGQKMFFFVTGAAIGVGGMVTGHDWLIWVAIVVLSVGLALRILGRRAAARAPEQEPLDDAADAGAGVDDEVEDDVDDDVDDDVEDREPPPMR
jgi:membrane protein implicated in regulation of membrane protease activity